MQLKGSTPSNWERLQDHSLHERKVKTQILSLLSSSSPFLSSYPQKVVTNYS